MKTPITLDKKYKYRNGEPARVLCVDGPDEFLPVISLTKNCNPIRHYSSGEVSAAGVSDYDLLEVREPREIWVNEYKNDGYAYNNEADAIRSASISVIRKAVRYVEALPEQEGGSEV